MNLSWYFWMGFMTTAVGFVFGVILTLMVIMTSSN